MDCRLSDWSRQQSPLQLVVLYDEFLGAIREPLSLPLNAASKSELHTQRVMLCGKGAPGTRNGRPDFLHVRLQFHASQRRRQQHEPVSPSGRDSAVAKYVEQANERIAWIGQNSRRPGSHKSWS